MSLETIYEAVLTGNAKVAKAETQAAVDAGVSAGDILHQACIPAMTEVGRLFEIGEKFVPEMLIAARAMQASLSILKPLLVEAETETLGKVVIGTVGGDLHDIGKNLVGMMLEGAGFEIIDLGTDVSPEKFVSAVQEHQPDLLGMSALLTTTMASIGRTIEALKEAGLRDQVKVLRRRRAADAGLCRKSWRGRLRHRCRQRLTYGQSPVGPGVKQTKNPPSPRR